MVAKTGPHTMENTGNTGAYCNRSVWWVNGVLVYFGEVVEVEVTRLFTTAITFYQGILFTLCQVFFVSSIVVFMYVVNCNVNLRFVVHPHSIYIPYIFKLCLFQTQF